MKLFNLLDTQYSKFSSTIKNYLSQVLNDYGSKYGNSTVFGQMINVLISTVQNIMLYIEDSLVEQNKYTAQRKKSIYGLASLSGYKPGLGKAATVQLKFVFVPNNSDSTDIIINNHEKLVCTQNGLTYNVILPQEAIILSVNRDLGTRVIQAVQGRFETQSFVSTGGKYYTINFKYNGNLDVDYIKVKVNGETWECVESIYDMNPDGKQFTFNSAYLGGVDLIFGNDVHGRALKIDDVIEVEYLVHDGVEGNLNAQEGAFFVFDDELYDVNGEEVDGNTIFNVTFANEDAVTSGSDSETKEQVRLMIGLNSRSLVLATPDHYKSFFNKFSFCGYNRTWPDAESLVMNSLIVKNFKNGLKLGADYFNLTYKDFILSDVQKRSLVNCLENSGNQLAGVTINIIDPEIRKYSAYVYIKMKNDKIDKEWTKNHVRTLIGEFFSNIISDMFIPKSDIIHLIKDNVDGVDSVDIYFLSERNENAIMTGSYVAKSKRYNSDKHRYELKEETVYVYPGENPGLGLDAHGNILLERNEEFPVLLGGWDFKTEHNQLVKTDALTITIE